VRTFFFPLFIFSQPKTVNADAVRYGIHDACRHNSPRFAAYGGYEPEWLSDQAYDGAVFRIFVIQIQQYNGARPADEYHDFNNYNQEVRHV
jgi:hypothetical protein